MQEKLTNDQTIKAEPVRVLKLEEMKVVGFPINVSFQDGDFSKIGKTKQLFFDRLNEIKHAVDTETYWAPWYSCENMFSYFYCLQVNELSDIPEGMMGFTIPAATYTVVYYDGPHPMNPDPYTTLSTYRQENGLIQAEKKMILEKYRFDQVCIPQESVSLEVYGPVKQN